MKNIPIEDAYKILEDASAIIINDSVLVYPNLSDIDFSDENEFMYLSWDEEGLEYNLKFNEGDNQMVKIVGSSMFLYDTDANGEEDHTQITILTTKELE